MDKYEYFLNGKPVRVQPKNEIGTPEWVAEIREIIDKIRPPEGGGINERVG